MGGRGRQGDKVFSCFWVFRNYVYEWNGMTAMVVSLEAEELIYLLIKVSRRSALCTKEECL